MWGGWKDYQSGPCNSECNEPNDVSGRKLDGSTTVPDFLLLAHFFSESASEFLMVFLPIRPTVLCHPAVYSAQ